MRAQQRNGLRYALHRRRRTALRVWRTCSGVARVARLWHKYAIRWWRVRVLLHAITKWSTAFRSSDSPAIRIAPWHVRCAQTALQKLHRWAVGRAMLNTTLMPTVDCLVAHKARYLLRVWHWFVVWSNAVDLHAATHYEGVCMRSQLCRWAGLGQLIESEREHVTIASMQYGQSCARRWKRRATILHLAQAQRAKADALRLNRALSTWYDQVIFDTHTRQQVLPAQRVRPASRVLRRWVDFASCRLLQALLSRKLRCRNYSCMLARVNRPSWRWPPISLSS